MCIYYTNRPAANCEIVVCLCVNMVYSVWSRNHGKSKCMSLNELVNGNIMFVDSVGSQDGVLFRLFRLSVLPRLDFKLFCEFTFLAPQHQLYLEENKQPDSQKSSLSVA